MKEEKFGFNFDDQEQGDLSATRAKNKTMMLSPEITSKVRHQVLSEPGSGETSAEPTRRITLNRESLLKIPSDVATPQTIISPKQSGHESPTALRPEEPLHNQPQATPNQNFPFVTTAEDNSPVVFNYKSKKGKLVGFLITYHFDPEGEYFPLYEGRLIVSKKPDFSDTNQLIIKDETVDLFHAILKVTEGKILVLDQLSDNGTKVIKKESGEVLNLCGEKAEADSRDKIVFGNVEFIALLI